MGWIELTRPDKVASSYRSTSISRITASLQTPGGTQIRCDGYDYHVVESPAVVMARMRAVSDNG